VTRKAKAESDPGESVTARDARLAAAVATLDKLEATVTRLEAAVEQLRGLAAGGSNGSTAPRREPLTHIDGLILRMLQEREPWEPMTSKQVTDELARRHLVFLDPRDLRRRHLPRLVLWGVRRTPRGAWLPPEERKPGAAP